MTCSWRKITMNVHTVRSVPLALASLGAHEQGDLVAITLIYRIKQ